MTGRRALGALLAGGSGLAMAAQARINGELAVRIGDGVAAAVVSFGTGLAVLAVLVVATGPGRRGLRAIRAALRGGSLRWWHCLGGVCGGFVVASQGLTVATLGVAVFTVAGVAGQTASSLLVDKLGVGPAGRQPLTRARVVGAVLALVAVVIAVSGRLGDPSVLALAALPALAGVGSAFQQGLNGQVATTASRDGYGAVAAAVVNFAVAITAVTVVFGVDLALRGAPRPFPTDPWLYIGGACGVAFITLAAAVVRVVGVFVLGLTTIAGQLTGSLMLDLVSPVAAHPVTVSVVAGTALALLAVVIASRR